MVQILQSSTSKSAPNPQHFHGFGFRIALTRRHGANFVDVLRSRSFAPPCFSDLYLCEPSKPRTYGKTQHFAQFLPAKISYVSHLRCKTSLCCPTSMLQDLAATFSISKLPLINRLHKQRARPRTFQHVSTHVATQPRPWLLANTVLFCCCNAIYLWRHICWDVLYLFLFSVSLYVWAPIYIHIVNDSLPGFDIQQLSYMMHSLSADVCCTICCIWSFVYIYTFVYDWLTLQKFVCYYLLLIWRVSTPLSKGFLVSSNVVKRDASTQLLHFEWSPPWHHIISYYDVFVTNSDILCAKIWRGREGEDNSDEI